MAELLLGNLDKKTVFTIITNDGKKESFEQYFIDLNPMFKSMLEDLFSGFDEFDVNILPDEFLLKQILDYSNLKVLEKWCEHQNSVELEQKLNENKDNINEVMTEWHKADSWEVTFIDKMLNISAEQVPRFKLFMEVYTLADFLGNQKFCHSLTDRWVNFLHTRGYLDPKQLESILNLKDGFMSLDREKLWKKFDFET